VRVALERASFWRACLLRRGSARPRNRLAQEVLLAVQVAFELAVLLVHLVACFLLFLLGGVGLFDEIFVVLLEELLLVLVDHSEDLLFQLRVLSGLDLLFNSLAGVLHDVVAFPLFGHGGGGLRRHEHAATGLE